MRKVVSILAVMGFLSVLAGCGVGETAATAAAVGASKAQEAEEAQKTQERVKAQLDAAAEAAQLRLEQAEAAAR